MNALALRTTIIWVHALAGAGWATAAAAFVIAAAAMAYEGSARHVFACRAASTINRLGAAAVATLGLTGLLNLSLVAEALHYRLSDGFLVVLGAKVTIFAAMAAALVAAFRAERALTPSADGEDARALARLMHLNGAIAAMGAVALALGLWLAGS